VGQRSAVVSASDSAPDTLKQMAERAVAMASEAPEDPHIGLADPDQLARDWDIARFELADDAAEPAPAALQEAATRAEAAALAHKGISQVQSASAGYGARNIHLAATNGFSGGYRRTDTGVSVVAITGEGTAMERDYAGESRIMAADLPTPEEIGALAAERTLARAGARKPPTGAFPVLYDERISGSLIGHLLAAVSGAAVARGASWLRDALGTQVLPAGLSLIEDPHRPRISGSRPFDAEGLATARRAIVQDGVLTGWTLDLATGRKLGMPSTANAARGTSGGPQPSVGNVALTQGERTRDDLMAEMGTGLLVTSMIGSSINATTGDYSRGASGFWVENGEIAYPVNECTIAGNLRDMLRQITPANDARAHLSRQVPSLLVEGLTIAGS
jgi:PmbA protein